MPKPQASRSRNGVQPVAASRKRPSSQKPTGGRIRKEPAQREAARDTDEQEQHVRPAHPPSSGGNDDERESLVNDRSRGPANQITPKVEEVASIHGFMNDLDCKMLDPAVVGEECVESAAAFYEQHVQIWLDRDPVLSKAEVRDTGGGLHVILWLDQPIIVAAGDAPAWDAVARGICNALPGDPNLNGVIALTRPVGALNTKYAPPREVRLLREGRPVTQVEILDLSGRITERPAPLWMRLFFGGERTEPCPLCGGASLGVAGYWQCRCYDCGRINAASLVYRFYCPEFLDSRTEARHG